MPSAVIRSRLSYPAVPLARQPVHQRSVLPNPLVLKKHPLKIPGAEGGPKGSAVRRLKWYASWVQTDVNQVGPYLPWAQES